MPLPEQIIALIIEGDLLPIGGATLAITGVTAGKSGLPWAQVHRIGVGEQEIKISKLKAAGYGGVAAATAGALLAGPVGILAAAGVGAFLGGMKRSEIFEIWTADGKCAVIKAPSGSSKQARVWRDMAAQLTSGGKTLPS